MGENEAMIGQFIVKHLLFIAKAFAMSVWIVAIALLIVESAKGSI